MKYRTYRTYGVRPLLYLAHDKDSLWIQWKCAAGLSLTKTLWVVYQVNHNTNLREETEKELQEAEEN